MRIFGDGKGLLMPRQDTIADRYLTYMYITINERNYDLRFMATFCYFVLVIITLSSIK